MTPIAEPRSGAAAPPLARRIRRSLARSLGIVVLALGGWGGGLIWFASAIPRAPERPEAPTDAIVVLTGGASRLKAGLSLLAERRARKLFVSGVYRGIDVSELLRVARQSPGDVECCIVLGYAADNTAGNALETRDWMAAEGFSSLRLVTASYHIRRSLLEFRRAMPQATIIPHAVVPDGFHQDEWWRWPGTANLILAEYNKYLFALLRFGPSSEDRALPPTGARP